MAGRHHRDLHPHKGSRPRPRYIPCVKPTGRGETGRPSEWPQGLGYAEIRPKSRFLCYFRTSSNPPVAIYTRIPRRSHISCPFLRSEARDAVPGSHWLPLTSGKSGPVGSIHALRKHPGSTTVSVWAENRSARDPALGKKKGHFRGESG